MILYPSPGALHMHTTHSDGSGAVGDLVLAARAAGLEWIWITDHDTLAGRDEAGRHDGVTTVVGYEITPPRNHYLVGGLSDLLSRELEPAAFVAEVAAQGGVGFIAHPDERATNEVTVPYRWDDWSIRGFTGIELWNFMSDWVEHYRPATRMASYFFPDLALSGPTANTLAWWDELQREGHHATGVFGVDAHAFHVRRYGRRWVVFPYEMSFRRLVNYLLLERPLAEQFNEAEQQIWSALRRGRVIMADHGRGNAAGTAFFARIEGGEAIATCGDTLPLEPGLMLDFVCPHPAEIRLFYNGTPVSRVRASQKLRFSCREPGHYRIEARRRRSLWILTNHIHVTDDLPGDASRG